MTTTFEDGGLTLSGFSTMVSDEWREQLDDQMEALKNGSNLIWCYDLWNDPNYMNASTMYTAPNGKKCMKRQAVDRMTGIPNVVDVIVEYSDRASPFRYVWVTETYGGSIVMYILTSLVILWALGIGIHILRYRDHQVYRASSPTFLLLTLLGVLLIAASTYFRIGKQTTAMCMTPWWFFGIGYALVFSCVCAKNWRIWKIFTSRRLKSRGIMDIQLLIRWVVSYLVMEIVMLTIWTIVDPLIPTYSRSPLLSYDEVQIVCESSNGPTLFIIFCVFNLFLLVPVGVIAYLSRSAKGEYDEARPMGMLLYATVIIEVVFFLVAFGITPHYQITFYLFSAAAWLASSVILAVYFSPKVIRMQSAHSVVTPSDNAVDMSGLKSFNSEMTADLRSLRSHPEVPSLRTPTASLADDRGDADHPPGAAN